MATFFDRLRGTAGDSDSGNGEMDESADMADAVDSTDTAAGNTLALVLDSLRFPALVLGTDGTITNINREAATLFRTDRKTATGRRPHSLLDVESDATDLVAQVFETDEDCHDVEETFVVDGTEVPVSRSVTRLVETDGTVAGAIEIDRDITERVRQREEKAQLQSYQESVVDAFQSDLGRLAKGDLTVTFELPEPDAEFEAMAAVYDEYEAMAADLTAVVESFRVVLDRLTELSESVADTSDTLSASSEEVTASIEEIDASTAEMADGSQKLAGQTVQTEQNVDDLSASIQQITATAQQIDARSREAASLADDGVTDIRDALGEIRESTAASKQVVSDIDALEESMREVGEIVEVIGNIAEETNILALNANIEAARAGKEGEGFAVVANEVKNLAEASEDSTRDITDIIAQAQERTNDLARSIKDANSRVASGADAVDETVETVEGIRERVRQTQDGVSEITDAVESQAHNAERVSSVSEETAALGQQISASIQEIAAGIDEQAQAMDETASRAQLLSSVSDDLHELVDRFRLDSDENADVDDVVSDIDEGDASVAEREDETETESAVPAGATEGRKQPLADDVADPDPTDDAETGTADESAEGPSRLTPDDF